MESTYKDIIELIQGNKTFCIASHAHPDGDAIGSTLALGKILRDMGKKVLLYNEDKVPRMFHFLPDSNEIKTAIDKNIHFDVTFMVDCGQPERAGKDFPGVEQRGKLVCIDHHLTGGEMADYRCQDEGASSTGEVVCNIIKLLDIKLDKDLATLILTTIIEDTGFFRYSNTSSHTLKIASELVAAGASTWEICMNMEEREALQKFDLLRHSIATLDKCLNNKVAVMYLTKQMLKFASADVEMSEDFINYARSLDGIEVAVMIRELEKNTYKISLRSKEYVDVAEISKIFEGGGHKHAAGCTIQGSLGHVRQLILKNVAKVI